MDASTSSEPEIAAPSWCYDFGMENTTARTTEKAGGFRGRTVLSFESRRAAEIRTLIENLGGRAIVAPATREVPATKGEDVRHFVASLLDNKVDLVIFLTGVGTRALVRAAEPFSPPEQLTDALRKVKVLARGPKPVAALREFGIPIEWTVPEPNTWREILQLLDDNRVPLKAQRVAVQEYGVPSKDLVDGLRQRGAEVMAIHVYDWALPEDVAPLRSAIQSVIDGRVDFVLFTAGVQVHHMVQVAEEMGLRASLIRALQKVKIASIGPVTSEALNEYELKASMEPSHPKMGFLVKEAAELA
jgi:uroporphyrinogen-III synthase